MKHLFSLLVCLLTTLALHAAQVGTWNAYMAYYEPTEIEQGGNKIYVLASQNLYSYNTTDHSLTTYDKVNALSDCNIAHIAWCQAAKRLVIVYENSNIDLLSSDDNVTNVSDFYSKTMTEDKTVHHIYIQGSSAYLSTSFGILKLNVADGEISSTYQLGFRVDYSYISGSKIYAASSTNGLYAAEMSTNLLDKANWSHVGDYVSQTKTMDADLLSIVQTLSPGGPKYNHFGFLRFKNNTLYSCGGGFGPNTEDLRPGCVQIWNNDEWTFFEDDLESKTSVPYVDVLCMDTDPKNEQHAFVGGRSGLYEFLNGSFVKLWNYDNSPLGSALSPNNAGFVLVEGLTYGDDGNLWVLNSQSLSGALSEYNTSGTWEDHQTSALKLSSSSTARSLGALQCPFFDSRGLLWFVNNHWQTPALFCYQPSSGGMNSYKSFVNDDGTTVSVVYARCVAEDAENNIWLGTNVGPIMLEASEISSGGTTFTQVKVPRNDGTNYADYLLDGVDISCMAIDGGNRKWFGTAGNGAYLISSDNLEQLQHFTQENSPLLSDNIESIAINNETGEVFFGTENGLCSYMSDATQTSSEMTKETVYAYPNPVTPDYTGLITITGLSYNADVKIATSSGQLVAEGRSNGGTFTWDGCDAEGKRVASGVYMVMTATNEGKKGTVCKIAIVR